MSWKKGRIVSIDVETTGLDPEEDKIVELGTAVMKQGQILLRHGRLINPGIPIPKEATAIHGIQDRDVRDAPKFSDVTQKFMDHIQTADALVAYNWPFDAAFLKKEIGDAWKWVVSKKPILDPLVVVRLGTVGRWWKGTGRHKLENVAERFNIKVDGEAHTTAADCEMTLLVLNALMAHLPDDGYEATEMTKRCREVQDRNYKRWKKNQEVEND